MKNYFDNGVGEERKLKYDLRQIYAGVVGAHITDVADARKSNNYYLWFKAIEDLKTISKFNFPNPSEDLPEYERLRAVVIGLANKYNQTWNNGSKTSHEVAEIDKALRDLEEFIYDKMNEGHMFGSVSLEDDEEDT